MTIIRFGKHGLDLAKNAVFSVYTGSGSFGGGGWSLLSNFDDMRYFLTYSKKVATFEKDMWKLDGTYHIYTDNSCQIGYLGGEVSNASLDFSIYPWFRIEMSEITSTDGITIYFSDATDDYPSDMTVYFYDEYNSPIGYASERIYPTSAKVTTSIPVTGFKSVNILIWAWNKPYHLPRISGVDLDTVVTLNKENIISCSADETASLIASELNINILKFGVYSDEGGFSIVSPTSVYANIKQKEPIDVVKEISGSSFIFGKYFFDEWTSESENKANFSANDSMYILSGTDFNGNFYSGTSGNLVSDVLTVLFGMVDIQYLLDSSFSSTRVYGLIKKMSCREAVQQVLIAIGAYMMFDESGRANIKPLVLASDLASYDYTFTESDTSMNTKVSLNELVTKVNVNSHDYIASTDGTTFIVLIDDDFGVGEYYFFYDNPICSVYVSDPSTTITASLWEYNANYLHVIITGAGHLKASGYKYIDQKRVWTKEDASITDPNKQKVKTVDDVTLVNTANGQNVANRIYDYLQQRYLIKTRVYNVYPELGSSVLINTQSSKQLAGFITRKTSNLSLGYCDLEITGIILP